MDKTTLKNLLLEKINSTDVWLSKGQLYLTAEEEQYSPESCGRVLRLLEEEGLIQADYYKGKRNQKLARYSRLDTPKFIKPKVEIFMVDGQPVAYLL